ncbi:MAG: hypothetical protein ISS33_00975 [Candidatus Omnitrophica bacterium]|nr:hypothetical protein [Candidatus Omnitrophota bacterium]
MTKYKCRDVVLVDVMFSDGSGIKKRPALILPSLVTGIFQTINGKLINRKLAVLVR